MNLSNEQITGVIDGYITYINSQKKESNDTVHWNAGITPTKENWGLTLNACASGTKPVCASNSFAGAIQCKGFARFIAYLLTGDTIDIGSISTDEQDIGIQWVKITNLQDYEFKPGDIVETGNPHGAIVWKVEGETVQFLELWSSMPYGCKIVCGDYNDGIEGPSTQAHLRNIALHVLKCPTIEAGTPALVPGLTIPDPTTSTVRLYTSEAAYTEVEYDAGSTDSIADPADRTGYRFDGWYTSETGGTKVETYDAIPEGTTTLYARWIEIVKVSYMQNVNADGGPVVYLKTYDVGAALRPLPTINDIGKREGYELIGWYTSPSGGGKYEDYSVARADRTQIWAHWKYDIELYLNEGDTTSVATVSAQTGMKYGDLILKDPYTKCGYDHIGWAYDEGRTNVCNLDDYVDNKTNKLYAIWKVKEVTVTYNYGYKENEVNKTGIGTVNYGDIYDSAEGTNVPDMDNMVHPTGGYEFAGWYHDEVESSNKVTMDENHTLTAMWEPKEMSVSFNAGGDCEFAESISPITVRYGQPFGCLPVPKSNKLYEFSHWYIVYNDGEVGEYITSETIMNETREFSLCAEWITKKFVIYHYEDEDGSKHTSSLHMDYGVPYRDIPTLSEKTGYNARWVFKETGSPYDGSEFFPGMIVSSEHPMEITAEYTKKEIRVWIDYNGGIDENGYSSNNIIQIYGDPYALFLYNPTREGYRLNGWYYDAECTQPISSTAVITNPESHTIYAGWEKSITLTFNPGDSTFAESVEPKAVYFGEPYGNLPTPTCEDPYIFSYWALFDESGEEFDYLDADKIVEIEENHTAIAIWEKSRVLNLDPNGGTVSLTYRIAQFGKTYPVMPTPQKEGYDFVGWFFGNDTEYANVQCTRELIAIPSHPDTVYAKWTPTNK